MTISSHDVVMKQVRIAALKAKLSEYLRAVRRGETVAIFDRDTLIAEIVPAGQKPRLTTTKPAPGTPPLGKVKLPKVPKLNIDAVEVLLEDRRRR
jgi:antitoxin (DNA-binding transcriptional repressor) of toxin-antitoxin stability system